MARTYAKAMKSTEDAFFFQVGCINMLLIPIDKEGLIKQVGVD